MNGYPQGLLGALGLNEEDLRKQSMTSGLLNAGLQMLAASGPSPVRQSLGQIIAQGGAAGLQGMQQAQESAIDRALKSMQVQSLVQKQTQEQEAARRQADAMASLRSATQPVTAQSALAAPGRVGPTAERAAMVGQTPQFTREQALQLGLNPDLPKDLRESLFKYVEATAPKEPKGAPGVVGEYQAAAAAGLIPPGTTLPQYIVMKKPPAAVATAIAGGGVDLTPGQKKLDEKAADDIFQWQSGGGQDMAAQIAQLKPVIADLEAGKPITGIGVAVQPDLLLAMTNPRALQNREAVEEVVQRNLRVILGAQFTEKEGERLISRAFNPKLPPAENAKRVRRLFMQMETAAEQKQAMVDYFNENGTLKGFKGKMPTVSDFEKAMEKGSPAPATSARQNMPQSDVDLINRYLNPRR